MSAKKYSIMKEIQLTSRAIEDTSKRIEALEDKLNSESIPEKKKNAIKQELIEARKLLETHEAQLDHLEIHNKSTFMLCVGLVFLVFLFYMIYILFANDTSFMDY
ncbi:unnamed protein product [Phyllotreta striolata]|uniref:Coiled-coil domain-containing protein 167 n=1 Tax=Phyllotreta striolata TaxID=444603 RepID=A0A9N9TV95_PHYSR|nr:unnamed protein product [Phyllotreta striolata]